MMKKGAAALTATAVIMSAAMSFSASADTSSVSIITSADEHEWIIGQEDIPVIAEDILAGGDNYDIHITLSREYNDSMVIYFTFKAGDQSFELMYILMQAEQEMDIPLKDIINALNDRYPEVRIPYAELDSIVMTDTGGLIEDISLCNTAAQDDIPGFAVTEEGRRYELASPSAVLMDASATAGGNVGIEVRFGSPLDNGFDLRFVFVMNDGSRKTVRAYSTRSLSESGVLVNVRGLIWESGVDVQETASLTVIDKGDKDISSVRFGTGSDEMAEIRFSNTSAFAGDEDESENPGTGAGLAGTAVFSVLSGITAFLTGKRK